MLKPSQFDIEVERQELQRLMFDIRKYKIRPNSQANGLPKSNTMIQTKSGNKKEKQEASVVYVSSKNNANDKSK